MTDPHGGVSRSSGSRAASSLTPLVVFLLAPGLPPGNGSVQAGGQVTDNTVLLAISTPVALAVLVFFIYALVAFRERQPDSVLEGPAVRGDARSSSGGCSSPP